jgi:hypothetical protein
MEPLFGHEKLDVYCVELGLITWIADFMEDASQSCAQHRRELIEQLDRASLSVLLNTAEGNGKRQGRQRAKFFDDARGSRHSSAPRVSMRRLPSASCRLNVFAPVKKCLRASSRCLPD